MKGETNQKWEYLEVEISMGLDRDAPKPYEVYVNEKPALTKATKSAAFNYLNKLG